MMGAVPRSALLTSYSRLSTRAIVNLVVNVA